MEELCVRFCQLFCCDGGVVWFHYLSVVADSDTLGTDWKLAALEVVEGGEDALDVLRRGAPASASILEEFCCAFIRSLDMALMVAAAARWALLRFSPLTTP